MSYSWSEFGEDAATVGGYASDAFTGTVEYLENNEYAANLLTGAAAAGLNYMQQKDDQDFRQAQQERQWDRDDSLSQAPSIDAQSDRWSDLSNGDLTDGGLINGRLRN